MNYISNPLVKMSSTIIESIESFDDPAHWIGYTFTMSDTTQNISCKIENTRNCCEKWGVYTKSNLNDFIGAEYYSMDISKVKRDKYDEMRIIMVTITTNRGKITIQLYNEHNGYYEHDVFIQSSNGISTIRL